MAIVAYTGLPGDGKSYGIVENVILPALKKHRLVYTNIPINLELCLKEFGAAPVMFTTDDLKANPRWFQDVFAPGAILVFDEAWRLWPQGMKANSVTEEHKTFLAEHRHLVGENGFSTEVYFVTQDLSQLCMFPRSPVANTFRVKKLTAIGANKRFRVDVYDGPVSGPNPPKAKLLRQVHGGKYKAEIYRFYKSHTKSETGEAGDESRTDKRFNILGSGFIKVVIVFCIILGIFIILVPKKSPSFTGQSIQKVKLTLRLVNQVIDNSSKLSPDNRLHQNSLQSLKSQSSLLKRPKCICRTQFAPQAL